MTLKYAPDALDGIPSHEALRIMEKIDWIWENRHIVNHEQLVQNLNDYFKKRFGKYRIIYSFETNPKDEMIIHIVGTRDEIYKDAARKLGQ